ncbi:MAG: hypothetical protein AAGM67_07110 [Bacteroidota bacterium]
MRTLLQRFISFLLQPRTEKQNQSTIVLAVVVLSVLLWLSVTLNREYSATITYPVSVSDFPTQIFVKEVLNPEVSITAKGNGLELLGESFRFKRDTLFLRFDDRYADLEDGYIYLPNYNNQLAKELGSEVEISNISPERLYFSYEEKVSRKVPLVLRAELNLATSYHLVEDPVLQPDSVLLTGLPGTLDTIIQWFTYDEPTQKIDRQRSLPINVIDTISTISVEPPTVSLSVRPQRYREISLRVPVQTSGLPPEVDTVRLSHEQIVFTCLVPAPDYERYLRQLEDLSIDIPFESLSPDWPYLMPQPDLPEAVQLIRRDPLELTYTIVSR